MMAVGMGFVILFFLTPVGRTWKAHSWEQASCTIASSRVAAHGDGGYSIEVMYRYRYGGTGYTGTRANFEMGTSSDRKATQRTVDRLVSGSSVPCWVDPRRPNQAVLDRGITSHTWFGLVPGIFVLFGALGLYGTFWGAPAWLVAAAAAGEAAARRAR